MSPWHCCDVLCGNSQKRRQVASCRLFRLDVFWWGLYNHRNTQRQRVRLRFWKLHWLWITCGLIWECIPKTHVPTQKKKQKPRNTGKGRHRVTMVDAGRVWTLIIPGRKFQNALQQKDWTRCKKRSKLGCENTIAATTLSTLHACVGPGSFQAPFTQDA